MLILYTYVPISSSRFWDGWIF